MSDTYQIPPVNRLRLSLGDSVYFAQQVLDMIPLEDTDTQWRLFKLISEMRDIINNPPKV